MKPNYPDSLPDAVANLCTASGQLLSQLKRPVCPANSRTRCAARYTNIVARDWKKLAKFYIEVMQCKIKPPERDLKGEWLERVTALPGAHITGIHLYLPGYEENGPTLEIFQYGKIAANDNKKSNTEGFGHIAFTVDSVEECVAEIKAHGGGLAGEIIKTEISGAGTICFAYAHDPEGNIIEIQKWG